MITRLIISALAVLITAFTLDGVTVDPWWWALIVAIVLGFVNSCIRPLVKFFALPINLLTLGLFALVVNGLMVMLCAYFVDGFKVDGLGAAILFSIILAVVNWVLNMMFSND